MLRFLRKGSDLLVLPCAYALAYWLRFDGQMPPTMERLLAQSVVPVVAIQYATLVAFGVPNFAWRYIGLREATRMAAAVGASAVALYVLRFGVQAWAPQGSYASVLALPRSILAIDALLALAAIVGVRVLRRSLSENAKRSLLPKHQARAVIIVGAGQAGVMVARELGARPDVGLRAVAFVDDDILKRGTTLHGLPVAGTLDELPAIAARHGASEALIAIASLPPERLRSLATACDRSRLATKVIPGLFEVVGGQVNFGAMRDLRIEDLLRRPKVELEVESIGKEVRGTTVLITGAGGSIGAELCRQLAGFGPERLVLLERAETSLFYIHKELEERFPSVDVVPFLADIGNTERLRELFGAFDFDAVYHAAAHKHVPMLERNVTEALTNNLLGTKTVADLASRHGVRRFVLISTDKAVHPSSVMGTSKRAAELYIQGLTPRSDTRFVAVRFGNVLGSAGSVVPLFREQIRKGGPVTVTHPDMRRFFMTIPEACQLVLQAAVMGNGGEVFTLDMGTPVKIVDLARDMITLSGMRPDRDIAIVFTGKRRGEKLAEELSYGHEEPQPTRHPKVLASKVRAVPYEEMEKKVRVLREMAFSRASEEKLRLQLADLVPESTIAKGISSTPKALPRRKSSAPPPPIPVQAFTG